VVDDLDVGGVILLIGRRELRWNFDQGRPVTIEVESRGISWTNRPCRQDRPCR
jgi:hypothetical protein